MARTFRIGLAAILGFAGLVVAGLAVGGSGPLDERLLRVAGHVEALGGPLALLLFVGLYVTAALALIPSSALSLAAGLLYGAAGIPVAWFCIMLAAAVAFPLGRGAFLGAVRRFVANRPVLRTLAEVAEEEGWRMVLLVRVSGLVPFGLQNYALGATGVPFRPYLLATSLGVLPSILVYASIGAFGQATLRGADFGLWQKLLLALGVLASVALVVMAARKVRSRLRSRAIGRPTLG